MTAVKQQVNIMIDSLMWNIRLYLIAVKQQTKVCIVVKYGLTAVEQQINVVINNQMYSMRLCLIAVGQQTKIDKVKQNEM